MQTLIRKAKKEYNDIEKKLVAKFMWEADAQKHIDLIKKKLQFCDVKQVLQDSEHGAVPNFEVKESFEGRGRPKKDAKKKVDYVRAVCTIEINEEKIKEAVNKECCYVLVCTDTDSNMDETAILSLYKRNHLIESLWALFKSKRLSVKSFYLKREDRIKGLITLMAISVLANRLMLSKIRKSEKAGKLKFTRPDGRKLPNAITTNRLNEIFSCTNIIFINLPDNPALVLGEHNEILQILEELVAEWGILSTRFKLFWIPQMDSKSKRHY